MYILYPSTSCGSIPSRWWLNPHEMTPTIWVTHGDHTIIKGLSPIAIDSHLLRLKNTILYYMSKIKR